MKIIAIEEAFAMGGLKMVPKLSDYKGPRDPGVLADWVRRNADFTQLRLPDMDKNGVSIQVLSLTTPGIQAVRDVAGAVADAKAANDYLAGVVAEHPDRFKGLRKTKTVRYLLFEAHALE
jgi:2,3-dihydroxybenzoate decarboxylase